ncbi:hypothetical protein [Alteromonas sp. CYL-A6]|uniref:hypothetical protein n=1 Tax=Alteromonas nitratireducens TaxID=3390813 RepID=UPI0034BB0D0C
MFSKRYLCLIAVGCVLTLTGCTKSADQIIAKYQVGHEVSQNVRFDGYHFAVNPDETRKRQRLYIEKYGAPVDRLLTKDLEIKPFPKIVQEQSLEAYNAALIGYESFSEIFTPILEKQKDAFLSSYVIDEGNDDEFYVAREITKLAKREIQLNDPLRDAYSSYLKLANAYNEKLIKNSLIAAGYIFTHFDSDDAKVFLNSEKYDDEGKLTSVADEGMIFFVFKDAEGNQEIYFKKLTIDHSGKTVEQLFAEAELFETDIQVNDIEGIFELLENNPSILI